MNIQKFQYWFHAYNNAIENLSKTHTEIKHLIADAKEIANAAVDGFDFTESNSKNEELQNTLKTTVENILNKKLR